MDELSINCLVDVFFLKEKIIINPNNGSGDWVEVEGEDIFFIKKILELISKEGTASIKEVIRLGKGYLEEDIKILVSQLIDLEILVQGSCVKKEKREKGYASYVLNKKKRLWFIRRGVLFYFFKANSEDEAIAKAQEMASSFVYEVEESVVVSIYKGEAESINAKIDLPEEIIKKVEESIRNEVVKVNSSDGELSIFAEKHTKNVSSGSNQWHEVFDDFCGELGLIPFVEEVDENGIFPVECSVYLAKHKMPDPCTRVTDYQIGSDSDPVLAKGKAVMESIERYCGRMSICDSECVFGSWSELQHKAVDPRSIAFYGQLQFSKGWLKGLIPFDFELPLRWKKGMDFFKKKEILIPDFFLSYSARDLENQKKFFFSCSNGMAAHFNKEEAIKNGVLEVIERDAILIHWINRITPNKILVSISNEALRLKEKLGMAGYSLDLIDLTLDTVPVVMAIAHSHKIERGGINFCSGASAGECYADAINRALNELEISMFLKLGNSKNTSNHEVSIKNISAPLDHEAIYQRPGMIRHLNFLTEGRETECNLTESRNVFKALYDKKMQVVMANMADSLIENHDFPEIHVVRILIPGMIPITFGYGYEPLSMDRIYKIPKELELDSLIKTEEDAIDNYLPHFFP